MVGTTIENLMNEREERLSRLRAIAEGLGAGGSDGWAGVQSILRELEALEPGCCIHMASSLQLASVKRAYAGEGHAPARS